MTDDKTPTELSMWLSTYGLLTSKRIFERFNIDVDTDELIAAIKNPMSIYHQLLSVPLKNIFNGIIFQQAKDYELYAQKLFIDYLLSGEGSKNDDSPGGTTREDLELLRTKLLEVSGEFEQQELSQKQLISESQSVLIQLSSELQNILQVASTKLGELLKEKGIIKGDKLIQHALQKAFIHYVEDEEQILEISSAFWGKLSEVVDVALTNEWREEMAVPLRSFIDLKKSMLSKLKPFIQRADDVGIEVRSYRRQFYDIVLRTTEFINYLPDYRVDGARDTDNRSSLYFDSLIGGA